jgi:hypothetical protein
MRAWVVLFTQDSAETVQVEVKDEHFSNYRQPALTNMQVIESRLRRIYTGKDATAKIPAFLKRLEEHGSHFLQFNPPVPFKSYDEFRTFWEEPAVEDGEVGARPTS